MPKRGMNPITRLLDSAVALLARPLFSANSLDEYGNRGYVLLGLLFLVAAPVAARFEEFQQPVSRSPVLLPLFNFVNASANTDLPLSTPLGIAILLIYLFTSIWAKPRRAIGVRVADTVVRFVDWLVMGGEWCIEHRWYSLLLIGLLTATVTYTTARAIQDHSFSKATERDASAWLGAVDHFVQTGTVSSSDLDSYSQLPKWNPGFVAVWHTHQKRRHPLASLENLLRVVYDTPTTSSLSNRLQAREDTLLVLAQAQNDAPLPDDDWERQGTSLTHVFLGNVALRRFGGCETLCAPLLKDALLHFRSVTDTRYERARWNGEGRVFARVASAKLAGNADVPPVCATIERCIKQALRKYADAGDGMPVCSFWSKRKANNVTDLLLRVGFRFNALPQARLPADAEPWLRSRTALARVLGTQLDSLMNCTGNGPFVQTTFVTAAQASAIRVKLLSESSQPAATEVRDAARYLRIAYALNPADLATWSLELFCGVAREPFTTDFHHALSDGLTGMKSPDWLALTQSIGAKCR